MTQNVKVEYETVIGLEIHAQVMTQSKMFCGCTTRFGSEPNTQVCPVCTGMPGVLPVINRKAVEMTVRAGLATHCNISPYNRFARKNYFYPDLPKGYQVSQFELPLCEHGHLDLSMDGENRRIRILRIHMEEDAGKNMHEGISGASHVDLNRAGVPLMEIVSEPDLRSPEEAVAYLKHFRNILLYLGVCDGNMEEGSLRCDANVSIREKGSTVLGTRTELKNINSFRFVQKALVYEIARQEEILRSGGRVLHETRLWDPATSQTVMMRSKEEAHDYRYFPEPDLVPLELDPQWIEEERAALPELAEAKRARFISDYGLPGYDAQILSAEKSIGEYFEQCAALYKNYKTLSAWILSESLREVKAGEPSPLNISPEQLSALLNLMEQGDINRNTGKAVFEEMTRTGKSAKEIVQAQGLTQVSDEGAIEGLIEQVMANNPKELEAYRQGKDKLFGFFVGQVMKESKGKANPATVNQVLKKKLS